MTLQADRPNAEENLMEDYPVDDNPWIDIGGEG